MTNPLSYRTTGDTLRVRGINTSFNVNGPGKRLVVHFQGCDLGCGGCFNKELWSVKARTGVTAYQTDYSARELLRRLDEEEAEGITFSGGEPFQQGEEFLTLLALLRTRRGARQAPNIVVFTGYTLEELDGFFPQGLKELLMTHIDMLISGRFEIANRLIEGDTYASSSNQRVTLFGERFNDSDLKRHFSVDVLVDSTGGALITGFPADKVLREIKDPATRKKSL